MVFLLFWTYSFLGFLLEKGFALITRSEQQARRCFVLLPLCPVYGLGALAVLALPARLTGTFWGIAWWGGLTATAVEYAVHWLYDRLLGVRFWDYSGVWGNLRGRVCVPFSVAWGLLLAVGLRSVHRWLLPLLAAVPPWLTYGMLLLFAADAMLSARLLRQTGDPEAVRRPLLRMQKPPA